jgi:hypothetical protein
VDVLRRISRKNCRAVESRESNQRKKLVTFFVLKNEGGADRVTETNTSRRFCAYNAHSPPELG